MNELQLIEELRARLDALTARVAALEGPVAQPSTPPPPPQEVPEEGIPEELLLVMSAAIAAFLGKRPHIRQIRLIGSGAWAQQGRVSIQASHALSIRHE